MKQVFTLIILLVLSAGCKKSKTIDADTNSSRDNAFAETTFDDVENIAQEAGSMGSVSTYKYTVANALLSTCSKVTFQNINKGNPDTILIDFGTGCYGLDGRLRTGQVIVYYTSPYKTIGQTYSIKFNNYAVDGNQVTGSETNTTIGLNGSGNMTWSMQVNGTIAVNGGGTITWASTRIAELISGWNSTDSTINWSSAKESLTGTENGISSTGISYSDIISSPLIRDFTCTGTGRRYYTKGLVNLTPSGKVTRYVNYGNGACGSPVTVDINQTTYNIVLR